MCRLGELKFGEKGIALMLAMVRRQIAIEEPLPPAQAVPAEKRIVVGSPPGDLLLGKKPGYRGIGVKSGHMQAHGVGEERDITMGVVGDVVGNMPMQPPVAGFFSQKGIVVGAGKNDPAARS